MPTPVDPRWQALATRARAMRVELDRLDDQIELLDRDERAPFARRAVDLRGHLDELEAEIEAKAAAGAPYDADELVAQPPTGPTIAGADATMPEGATPCPGGCGGHTPADGSYRQCRCPGGDPRWREHGLDRPEATP